MKVNKDYLDMATAFTTIGFMLLMFILVVGYVDNKNKTYPCSFSKSGHFLSKEEPDTVHLVRATQYNPVASQTDSNPLTTADGSKIDVRALKRGQIRWCALSREQIWNEERQELFKDTTLWRGDYEFGDTVHVVSASTPMINGWWIVHDCMDKEYRLGIDFLFPTGAFSLGVIKDCKLIK